MRPRLKPRQWWWPWLSVRWWRAFPRRTSKRSGAGNTAGSRLAATVLRPRNSPAPSSTPPSSQGTAVQRSMKATGGISRMPSSIALPMRSGSARTAASASGFAQQQQHGVRERRLHGLDRAEQDHPQLRDDLLVREPSRGIVGDRARDRVVRLGARALDLRQEDRVELGARRVGAALRLGVAVVDHRAGEGLVELLHARDVVEREAEDVARDADRERRSELLDQLAAAARRELAEQRIDAALARARRSARARDARRTAPRTAAAAARARLRRC